MKVFVTGATGFVGYAVLRRLFQTGVELKVLVRPNSDVTRLIGKNIDVVEGDVRDADLLRGALQGCQRVYHAAGYHAMCGLPDDFERTNVEGTLNLLDAAAQAGVERVVYTSAALALGAAEGGSLADEETTWNLGDIRLAYLQSIHRAELEALAFAEGKLNLIVVNPTVALGPYDSKPTPFGNWIVRYLRGAMGFVPRAEINLVDVESVAQGHLLAMEKGRSGRRYILGGVNTTATQYFSMLSHLTGLRAPVPMPKFLSLVAGSFGQYVTRGLLGRNCAMNLTTVKLLGRRLHYSSDRARNELGWAPGDLEQASLQAVRWFCRNGYVRDRRAQALLRSLDDDQAR